MSVSKEIALSELEQSIVWFSLKDYRNTVKWLEFISNNVKEENPTVYDEDVRDAFAGYIDKI